MKSAFLVLIGLITVVVRAQEDVDMMRDLPACSLDCLSRFIPLTNCTDTDIACLCINQLLWQNTTECTTASCSIRHSLTSQRISTLTCGFPYRERAVNTPAISTSLCALAFVVLVLRMAVRWPGFAEIFGWDDATIIAAWVISVPMVPLDFLQTRNGLGKDIWMVPVDRISPFILEYWLVEHFYVVSANLVKISILCFYLRVFTTFPVFRRVVYGSIVFTILFIVAFYTTLFFQCRPVSLIWEGWDGEHVGKCVDITPGVRTHAVLNFLMDLAVMLLPLPLVYKVQKRYNWRKKIHIGLMFSFGFIAVVVNGLRMDAIFRSSATKNPTYDFLNAGIWALIETWVGIICACIPGTKVFVTKVAPRWLGLSSIDMSGRHGTGPAGSAAAAYGTKGSRRSVAVRRPDNAAVSRDEMPNDSEFVRLKDMVGAEHRNGVITKTRSVEVISEGASEDEIEFGRPDRESWLASR